MLKQRMLSFSRGRRGSALLLSVAVTGIILIVAGAVLRGALLQRRQSDRYQLYTEELSIAEFQLNKAFGQISYALQKAGANDPKEVIKLVGPAYVPNYEVLKFDIKLESDVTGDLPVGDEYAGYTMRQLVYRVGAHVKRTDARGKLHDHPGVAVQQDFKVTYVPLYAFGIFSDPDLELHPGADFVENGRIQANRNFFYGSDGKSFSVQNSISVADQLIYGRHPNSGRGLGNGNNRFWNGKELVSTKEGDKFIDSRYHGGAKKFADVAQDLWKGFVKDGSMGAKPLNLPWPNKLPNGVPVDPGDYIQPRSSDDTAAMQQQKYAYKAGLRITRDALGNVSATRGDGTTPVALTYTRNGQKISVVSSSRIYNEREGREVNILDLDFAKIREAATYGNNIAPVNGIVFVEDQTANGAVRIINGQELPGDTNTGFSLATPDPLYVKGDYNTVNNRPAMLLADAVTILSKEWTDAVNDTPTERNSAPTASGSVTTNAVIGAGNVPTQVVRDGKNESKKYSGGVENFFRYMENWGGKTHTFKGSILLMFHSRIATGFWENQKYGAPNRSWSWDTALQHKGPPGAPVSYVTSRSGWKLAEFASL